LTEISFTPPETGPNAPTPPVDTDRPAWLPDNFTKPEDLASSYKELQAKMTQQAQELAALKKPGDTPPEPPKDPNTPDPNAPKPADKDAEAAKKVADAAGFDLAPFSTEYATAGDVSEESRAKIAEGLKSILGADARTVVDQYIEGRKATDANDNALYMTEAGGAENYTAMITWAAKSLPADEIEAFNKAVDSGDRHSTIWAIQGLKGKFAKANGLPGEIITPGAGGGGNGGGGYASAAEMTRDMGDPKYKTDPAFREMVKRKLAAKTF
jgi:hypothetical protein